MWRTHRSSQSSSAANTLIYACLTSLKIDTCLVSARVCVCVCMCMRVFLQGGCLRWVRVGISTIYHISCHGSHFPTEMINRQTFNSHMPAAKVDDYRLVLCIQSECMGLNKKENTSFWSLGRVKLKHRYIHHNYISVQ